MTGRRPRESRPRAPNSTRRSRAQVGYRSTLQHDTAVITVVCTDQVHQRQLDLCQTNQTEQHPCRGDQLPAAGSGCGREDRGDDVRVPNRHGGTGEPGDVSCSVSEGLAGSARRQVRVDRVTLRLAVLTIEPGREGFPTVSAVHVTMVAHRRAGVPRNF
jgi:hypothetical protein